MYRVHSPLGQRTRYRGPIASTAIIGDMVIVRVQTVGGGQYIVLVRTVRVCFANNICHVTKILSRDQDNVV